MIATPMIAVVVVLPLLCVAFYKLQMLRALVDFELRLKYLIRRAPYLGYRIRVAVD